jgi:hypothetical protein
MDQCKLLIRGVEPATIEKWLNEPLRGDVTATPGMQRFLRTVIAAARELVKEEDELLRSLEEGSGRDG